MQLNRKHEMKRQSRGERAGQWGRCQGAGTPPLSLLEVVGEGWPSRAPWNPLHLPDLARPLITITITVDVVIRQRCGAGAKWVSGREQRRGDKKVCYALYYINTKNEWLLKKMVNNTNYTTQKHLLINYIPMELVDNLKTSYNFSSARWESCDLIICIIKPANRCSTIGSLFFHIYINDLSQVSHHPRLNSFNTTTSLFSLDP